MADETSLTPAAPQGMTREQFERMSRRLRELLKDGAERTGDLGNDLFVHGSRAKGTAAAGADLDVGIRVSPDHFDELLKSRLERVKPGGVKWETLQMAAVRGRLHAGEAGISGLRKDIQRLVNEEMNLGFSKGVQITVIRAGGPFDQGPYIELPEGSD